MIGSIFVSGRIAPIYGAVFLAILAVLMFGATAGASNHYPPNRAGAQQFAADFCRANPVGMADFVWLSAPSSEDQTTVTVVYPNTVVNVRVNVYTQYCSRYPSGADAGSTYSSSAGGVFGTFYYQNEVPGRTWYDYQIKSMNVRNWAPGSHRICMTLASWSAGLSPQPSPSACSVLNLNIIYPWQTSGWSRVGVANANPNVQTWPANPPAGERPAQPGDRLYWRHGISKTGGGGETRINFDVRKSGFTNGWPAVGPSGDFLLAPGNTQQIGYRAGWSSYSEYDVRQQDVGRQLCQWVTWDPSTNNGGSGSSAQACVTIPYSFQLTPRADVSVTAAEPGASATVNSAIDNSGPTKSLDDTRWQLSKFILAPGASIPSAGTSNNPCSPSWPRCTRVSDGTRTFQPGTTSLPQSAYTVEDLPLGSRVCFGLSVNKFAGSRGSTEGAGNWRNGTPDCLVVGKKPKVQIWGGDAAVRGTIRTSTTTKSGTVYGSWVEYGAFSVGANYQFASGAGLVNQTSTSQAAWSDLTFANTGTGRTPPFGYYAQAANGYRGLADIAGYFGALQNTQPFTGGSLDSNAFNTGEAVVVRTAGDLSLDGQNLPKGRSVVVVATGTVTIKGSINYDGTGLADLREIPQLVIVARTINIEEAVSNVDAWLVARDTIDTCSNAPRSATGALQLVASRCNQVLTVNGPVVTNQLHLNRTGGSGTGAASGDPAEIFRLRPDAYLWAQLVASGSGKAQAIYTIELPPRF